MAGSSDTPPFVEGTTPSSGTRIAIGGSNAIWNGENDSAVDTPDNSLPTTELSPAEAAAEAARREAVGDAGLTAVATGLEAPPVSLDDAAVSAEAAAAERVVQGAALAQALSPDVSDVDGVKNIVLYSDGPSGEVLYSGPLDTFLAAQGFVPPKTTAAGLMSELSDDAIQGAQVRNLQVTAENLTVSGGGSLSFVSSGHPRVRRIEVDNGALTVFGTDGGIILSTGLMDLVESQISATPPSPGVNNTTPTGPEALTQGREKTHGAYWQMAEITMDILRAAQDSPNWDHLPDGVKVMFFNLAQKSARILTGDPLVVDHYQDIAGYAYLAEQEIAHALSEKDFEDASGTD